jgi:hypothetical protein
MIKKITMFVFAALLIASFSYATTHSSKMSLTKTEATVQSVDSAKHTFTAMVGSDTKTYHFTTKTHLEMNGKSAKWSDVKVGDHIDIYTDSKGNVERIKLEQQTKP